MFKALHRKLFPWQYTTTLACCEPWYVTVCYHIWVVYVGSLQHWRRVFLSERVMTLLGEPKGARRKAILFQLKWLWTLLPIWALVTYIARNMVAALRNSDKKKKPGRIGPLLNVLPRKGKKGRRILQKE
jgi:hypothetical protein